MLFLTSREMDYIPGLLSQSVCNMRVHVCVKNIFIYSRPYANFAPRKYTKISGFTVYELYRATTHRNVQLIRTTIIVLRSKRRKIRTATPALSPMRVVDEEHWQSSLEGSVNATGDE